MNGNQTLYVLMMSNLLQSDARKMKNKSHRFCHFGQKSSSGRIFSYEEFCPGGGDFVFSVIVY